jgi:hypothetical protein
MLVQSWRHRDANWYNQKSFVAYTTCIALLMFIIKILLWHFGYPYNVMCTSPKGKTLLYDTFGSAIYGCTCEGWHLIHQRIVAVYFIQESSHLVLGWKHQKYVLACRDSYHTLIFRWLYSGRPCFSCMYTCGIFFKLCVISQREVL